MARNVARRIWSAIGAGGNTSYHLADEDDFASFNPKAEIVEDRIVRQKQKLMTYLANQVLSAAGRSATARVRLVLVCP
jgi:hypothetical protein